MAVELSFSTEESKTDQGWHFTSQRGLEPPEQFSPEICAGNKCNCCRLRLGLIVVRISAPALSGAHRC